MFLGSIPSDMRRVLIDHLEGRQDLPLAVGCSGNFTVERLAWSLGFRNISGCDVSIYSCAIGRHLAGKPIGLTLRDDAPDWHREFCADDVGQLATVFLLSKMAVMYRGKTLYHERMRKAYRDDWVRMHGKMVERIGRLTTRLAGFEAEDVHSWVEKQDRRGTFLTFPPFRSGDYEDMFRSLESVFHWEPPAYLDMDLDRLMETAKQFDRWLLAIPMARPAFGEPRAIVQTDWAGKQIYVYASAGPVRVAVSRSNVEFSRFRTLGPDDELVGVRVTTLPMSDFDPIRRRYSVKVKVLTTPDVPIGVFGILPDGSSRVVGILGVKQLAYGGELFDLGTHWLLSDLAVDGSRYKRLSKLVVACAFANETRLLIERGLRAVSQRLFTHAFSDKPASMKYRGIMQQIEHRWDEEEGHFVIKYLQAYSGRTLQQTFDDWMSKHGKVERGE